MNSFKKLMERLRPANRDWNYMEVKELSELSEAAGAKALQAVLEYRALKFKYDQACAIYHEQCLAKKERNWRHTA